MQHMPRRRAEFAPAPAAWTADRGDGTFRNPVLFADYSDPDIIRVGKTYYTVDVHDISLGGIKVEPIEEYCVGKKVVVVVESLRPTKGEVRWYSDRRAGIVFERPLEFEELSEWVGKRLELASLKASYKG